MQRREHSLTPIITPTLVLQENLMKYNGFPSGAFGEYYVARNKFCSAALGPGSLVLKD